MKILAYTIASLVVLSGCSDTVEPKGPEVSFGVEVVGAQANAPLTIRATFANSGGTVVELAGGCRFVGFTILSADSIYVPTVDPCGPVPLCQWRTRSLRPEDRYDADLTITGLTWDGCAQILLEPGTYTVEATTRYRFDLDSDQYILATAVTTFEWQ